MTKCDLTAQKSRLETELENTKVQFHRLSGAIADCEHWLAQLKIEKNSTDSTPKEPCPDANSSTPA